LGGSLVIFAEGMDATIHSITDRRNPSIY
jgi:hypothetical protein